MLGKYQSDLIGAKEKLDILHAVITDLIFKSEKDNLEIETLKKEVKRFKKFDVNKDKIILHKSYKINEENHFALVSCQKKENYQWINLCLKENSKILSHVSEVSDVLKDVLKYKQRAADLDVELENLKTTFINEIEIRDKEIEELLSIKEYRDCTKEANFFIKGINTRKEEIKLKEVNHIINIKENERNNNSVNSPEFPQNNNHHKRTTTSSITSNTKGVDKEEIKKTLISLKKILVTTDLNNLLSLIDSKQIKGLRGSSSNFNYNMHNSNSKDTIYTLNQVKLNQRQGGQGHFKEESKVSKESKENSNYYYTSNNQKMQFINNNPYSTNTDYNIENENENLENNVLEDVISAITRITLLVNGSKEEKEDNYALTGAGIGMLINQEAQERGELGEVEANNEIIVEKEAEAEEEENIIIFNENNEIITHVPKKTNLISTQAVEAVERSSKSSNLVANNAQNLNKNTNSKTKTSSLIESINSTIKSNNNANFSLSSNLKGSNNNSKQANSGIVNINTNYSHPSLNENKQIKQGNSIKEGGIAQSISNPNKPVKPLNFYSTTNNPYSNSTNTQIMVVEEERNRIKQELLNDSLVKQELLNNIIQLNLAKLEIERNQLEIICQVKQNRTTKQAEEALEEINISNLKEKIQQERENQYNVITKNIKDNEEIKAISNVLEKILYKNTPNSNSKSENKLAYSHEFIPLKEISNKANLKSMINKNKLIREDEEEVNTTTNEIQNNLELQELVNSNLLSPKKKEIVSIIVGKVNQYKSEVKKQTNLLQEKLKVKEEEIKENQLLIENVFQHEQKLIYDEEELEVEIKSLETDYPELTENINSLLDSSSKKKKKKIKKNKIRTFSEEQQEPLSQEEDEPEIVERRGGGGIDDYIRMEITEEDENAVGGGGSVSPIFSEGKLKRVEESSALKVKEVSKPTKPSKLSNNKENITNPGYNPFNPKKNSNSLFNSIPNPYSSYPPNPYSQYTSNISKNPTITCPTNKFQSKIFEIIENLQAKNELIKKLINLIHQQKEAEFTKNQKQMEKELLLEEFTLKNQVLEKEISNIKNQSTTLLKSNKEKDKEKNELLLLKSELENVVAEKENEIKLLLNQKTQNSKSQETSSKELEMKISLLNKELLKLESEKNELKKKVLEKDSLHLQVLDEISLERMKKEEIIQEKTSLEKRITEKNEFIRKLQEKVVNHEEEVNNVNNKFDEQYYKIQELEANIRKHIENEDFLNKKLIEQEKKIQKILKEKNGLVEELDEIEKSNLKLSSSLINANNLIEKKSSIIERMKSDNSVIGFFKESKEKEEKPEFLLGCSSSNEGNILKYNNLNAGNSSSSVFKDKIIVVKETEFIVESDYNNNNNNKKKKKKELVLSLKDNNQDNQVNDSLLEDFNSIMNEEENNPTTERKGVLNKQKTEENQYSSNRTPILVGMKSSKHQNIPNFELINLRNSTEKEVEKENYEINLKYKNYSSTKKKEENKENSDDDFSYDDENEKKIKQLELKIDELNKEINLLYSELQKEKESNTNLLSIKETLEESLKQEKLEIENHISQERIVRRRLLINFFSLLLLKAQAKNRRIKF